MAICSASDRPWRGSAPGIAHPRLVARNTFMAFPLYGFAMKGIPMPGHRFLLCLALLACTRAAQLPSAPERPVMDVAGMDPAVAPGDEFFFYANGGWIKSTEIPADRSRWGPASALEELTSKRVADLIAEAARSEAAAGSEARKIGDFYASYMD